MNWDALRLVVERSDSTELEKGLLIARFFKAVRRHGIESLQPQLRYSYCAARLALGDFSDYWGWEMREEWSAHLYWDETWMAKWGGGNVRRLLIVGEQGVGDAIFFASIIPEAMIRAQEVIFECDARLHTLLERSLPGLKCRPEREFEDRRQDYGEIDAFIPAMDLMRMFRRDRKHFPGKPYLKPDAARVAEFEKYRGRTGISWRARQGVIDPLALGIDNPLSVQYGAQHEQIEVPEKLDTFADIEGLVALASVLGRVVTVPTSIHHFAGAVGSTTQIIVPPEGSGEVVNQIRWDYPVGRLPWYRDAVVYESINHWRHHERPERHDQ